MIPIATNFHNPAQFLSVSVRMTLENKHAEPTMGMNSRPPAARAGERTSAPTQHGSALKTQVPVILVHGIFNDSRTMEYLAARLRKTGREVHCVTLSPSSGSVGLDKLAHQLKTYVGKTVPAGAKFDLVGFSMGGLISRYYLQRLSGLERVRRFITISSPHRGTLTAFLIPNTGSRQMRPNSPFLRDLESDAERLVPTGFTSLWTPLDLTILPANSSVIPSAKCHSIPCIAHPLMVYDSRCFLAVEAALK